jgi:hypothetical protein
MEIIERIKNRSFYWFYFLLNMQFFRFYKIILETFLSDDFFSMSNVVMLNTYKFRKYKFKYVLINLFRYKDSWRWRNYKHIHFYDYFYLIYNRSNLNYILMFKQIYLNIFIQFLFNNIKSDAIFNDLRV